MDLVDVKTDVNKVAKVVVTIGEVKRDVVHVVDRSVGMVVSKKHF